jgi:hypothetical protein
MRPSVSHLHRHAQLDKGSLMADWRRNTRNPLRAHPPREVSLKQRIIASRKWFAAITATVIAATLATTLNGWVKQVPGLDPSTKHPTPPTLPTPTPVNSGPISVIASIDQDHCMTNWYAPRLPNKIKFSENTRNSDAPDATDWPSYTAAESGFPASPMEVLITVQGHTETEVHLTKIEVRIRHKSSAPAGTLLNDPCGDPGAYRWLAVDLDKKPPRLTSGFDKGMLQHWLNEPGSNISLEERTPIRFPYKVSSTRAETFLITARTKTCDCEWTAILSWQSAGKTGKTMITDNGNPFHTIGVNRAVKQCTSAGQCQDEIEKK